MDRHLTGIGDGCDSCLTPRKLWTDLDTIETGFAKNRTLEDSKNTWLSLDKDKTGCVIKRRDDYETRQGLCHEPVTLRETFSFTLTHKVSRILGSLWKRNTMLMCHPIPYSKGPYSMLMPVHSIVMLILSMKTKPREDSFSLQNVLKEQPIIFNLIKHMQHFLNIIFLFFVVDGSNKSQD